ncbi:hypothetical protein JOD43_000924 [Pullulanibacillus pueri]|uniref:hypothetical protein n=1 Tax=Pullulanibacillus pueri TaxID=1437324 RepID=UPI001668E6AC|nr:hypothetical protein [Pullulanibacillus pueri]MBM7680760.1 hypothetical protein [Pullulanibacillus pueri]
MKSSKKLLLLAMLIVPWLTLPLLGRKNIKKYFLSALLMCIFTKGIDVFGRKKNWWEFYKGIRPLNSMDMLNLGPYFIMSFWMLRLTYGRFLLYLLSNSLLHYWFIFKGGLKFTSQHKILSLVKLTKFQYLIVDFCRALLLYAFQFSKDWISNRRRLNKKEPVS